MTRYTIMFWIPAIASTLLLLVGWRTGDVHRAGVVGSLLVLGIALQLAGTQFSPVWLAGVLISVTLGIYLSIRMRLR